MVGIFVLFQKVVKGIDGKAFGDFLFLFFSPRLKFVRMHIFDNLADRTC